MLAAAKTGKNRERYWKKNAGEWTGRVEISKEEIPGSKRTIRLYTDILQALMGEPPSFVF